MERRLDFPRDYSPLPSDMGGRQGDLEIDSNEDPDADSNASTFATLRGTYQHGRRYQMVRDSMIMNQPSDQQHFDSMHASHMVHTTMECTRQNPYFRSPIGSNAEHILDLGCGQGDWAIDVADMFPGISVQGIDLFPPPTTILPNNCFLECDDYCKPWVFNQRFDLVYMRLLVGSVAGEEWDKLYRRAYDNIVPGGWIEHLEVDLPIHCDDGTLPEDSLLASAASKIIAAATEAGQPPNIASQISSRIERAGFTNCNEITFKTPIGGWAKLPIYKEAGRLNMISMKEGLEGWMYVLTMWLFTRHGRPEPWTEGQVKEYVDKLKAELDKGWHIYQYTTRVWAQKPLDADERPETRGESRAEGKGQARGKGKTESMGSTDIQTGRYDSGPSGGDSVEVEIGEGGDVDVPDNGDSEINEANKMAEGERDSKRKREEGDEMGEKLRGLKSPRR